MAKTKSKKLGSGPWIYNGVQMMHLPVGTYVSKSKYAELQNILNRFKKSQEFYYDLSAKLSHDKKELKSAFDALSEENKGLKNQKQNAEEYFSMIIKERDELKENNKIQLHVLENDNVELRKRAARITDLTHQKTGLIIAVAVLFVSGIIMGFMVYNATH